MMVSGDISLQLRKIEFFYVNSIKILFLLHTTLLLSWQFWPTLAPFYGFSLRQINFGIANYEQFGRVPVKKKKFNLQNQLDIINVTQYRRQSF